MSSKTFEAAVTLLSLIFTIKIKKTQLRYHEIFHTFQIQNLKKKYESIIHAAAFKSLWSHFEKIGNLVGLEGKAPEFVFYTVSI